MWATCRREHRLTWEEFQDLTLAEWEALEERRAIEIRHGRFNAALITAALVNVHRGEGTEPVSPFDLIPGMEATEEEVEMERARKDLRQGIYRVMTSIPEGSPPEVYTAARARLVQSAADQGFDGEALYQEVFAD